MKDQENKQIGLGAKIQQGLINLTNELLRSYRVSRIVYIFIKVLEHLQMIYFLMRAIDSEYHWDFSFIVFVSVFLNLISLDQLFQSNPTIFLPIFYGTFSLILIIAVLAIVISANSGWSKRTPFMVKFFTPVVCTFLYLLKTILIIPILDIILISLIPSIGAQLKIDDITPSIRFLGALLAVIVIFIFMYNLVMLREPNPFSELPFAGQTFSKGLIWFFLKVIMVFYSLFDLKGNFQLQGTAILTALFLLAVVYSHWQTGLYKTFNKRVEIHLLYLCLALGILHTSDFSGGEVTTIVYLPLLNLLMYFVCQWVIQWKNRRIVTTNLHLIQESRQLEQQIIYLINIIDNLNLRECRVALEGFVNYHRRKCRIGEDCPCKKLAFIKEKCQEEVKLQAFKFVAVLLADNRRKFPQDRKLDLLLGLLYHYRIKNSLQAVYAITKMACSKSSDMLDRLYQSYYLQKVEKQMLQSEEKQISKISEITKFFDYTNKLVKFQSNIERCTNHHIQFWRLILDANPDIRRLQDLGTQITRTKDNLRTEFDYIFSSNSNSIHLLTIYGKFLLEVTNQEIYNVKYLEKADTILKNIKQSNKIDEAGTKYSENANTLVVIISGDDGKLGHVVHTSNLLKDTLGYKRLDLVDRNVSVIMPKIYAQHHNETLSRYINSSESKVNGHERIVPALTKEGFMLPMTALTKVLPSLINGIQIVAFLAKFEQKNEDDELVNKKCSYILYRTDTEQIVGICEEGSTSLGINPCLIYGNALNISNELKLKHIFGISFQKSEEGRISAALEVGEVLASINTKRLKDDFIINVGSKESGLIDLDYQAIENQGVETQVTIKNILSSVYHNIPLKLLSLSSRKPNQLQHSSNSRHSNGLINYKKKTLVDKKKKDSMMQPDDFMKNEADDFKNLKDFKNFISIKRQPSAITALSTICLLFILLLFFSIVGLVINNFDILKDNQSILELHELTLGSEMSCPEILMQTEKLLLSSKALQNGISTFTSFSKINSTLYFIDELIKAWHLKALPYKYFFDSGYDYHTRQYTILSTGKYLNQSYLMQEVINNYVTKIHTLVTSNYVSFVAAVENKNLSSNLYEKFSSARVNMLQSIRYALNESNTLNLNWYNSKIASRKITVIAVNCLMMGAAIIWVIILLPYILSVTKINNRVLSLFTLISSQEIAKLIHSCFSFLKNNLKEAVINEEEYIFYEEQQNRMLSKESARMKQSSAGSPSQLNLASDFTQGELKRGSKMYQERDSVVGMEEKFQKMINSQDRNKKLVICKFILISLLILGFVLFYLFFSLSFLQNTKASVYNFYIVGRRPALIRNVKLLLTEYLINPQAQYLSLSSIRTLNQQIINQFFSEQASLLFLDFGSSSSLFNTYNNNDVCASVFDYSSFSIYKETLSSAECYNIHSGVLQKGLKTGVASVFQDIRSILVKYPTSVPLAVMLDKILEYDALVKYIETPMLKIRQQIKSNISTMEQNSKLVILLVGAIFIGIVLLCWKFIWGPYVSELNVKIWRTKGLLNLIPMRIITANELLKNEFTSGQLQKAVK